MNADQNQLARKTLVVCGVVLAVFALVTLLFVSRSVLPLVFGGALLAVVLNRLAALLGKVLPGSLSQGQRMAIVITLLSILAVVMIFGFANAASEQFFRLSDRLVNTAEQVLKEQPWAKRFVSDESKLQSLIPSSSESLGWAKNFFATAFGGILDLLILTVVAFYFAASPDKYRSGSLRLVPQRFRDKLSTLLDQSGETLWRWMLGRLLAMAIVGVLFAAGLAILGVPMSIELGIFAALVTFIPNIGGIAAVVPALLLATEKGTTTVLAVLGLYVAIQFVESYLITPKVQEHQVSLPPAMVILAQIVAGIVFGFWGVVFATPLFAIAILWVDRLYVQECLG